MAGLSEQEIQDLRQRTLDGAFFLYIGGAQLSVVEF